MAHHNSIIYILRIAESIHLPVAWNIHGLPFGIIKIFLVSLTIAEFTALAKAIESCGDGDEAQ